MTVLFVLGTIVFFLMLEWGVSALRERSGHPVADLVAPTFRLSETDLALAPGAFHSPAHTWATVEESGMARVGIDDFAIRAIGRPDRVEVPKAGTIVTKGEPLFTAMKNGRRITFASPLTGRVEERNAAASLRGAPSWLVRLAPGRLAEELKLLKVGEEAMAWLAAEVSRFREFLVDGMKAQTVPATLPDGGLPAEGVLSILPVEVWESFEDEFLAEEE
jgi:glycine cleavage system H lipoate-binding protein